MTTQTLKTSVNKMINQVQNKLDGLYYAIKSIPLNQRNKAIKAKIVREVKLLSRLNHGNVVRWFHDCVI